MLDLTCIPDARGDIALKKPSVACCYSRLCACCHSINGIPLPTALIARFIVPPPRRGDYPR